MARRYAPVLCSIWDDPEFQARTPGAQRVYILLLSQKRLSMVGVVPYAPRNWSRGSTHTTPADVIEALDELAEHRYIITDHDTDELLVRTVMKHDPPRGPKVLAAMWRALSTVDSEMLRREVSAYITDEMWDNETATPPDELKYLRNTPSDTPPDGVSDTESDGVRTRARASSFLLPPSSGLLPPCNKSSSVLTVVRDSGADDDDFSRTLSLIADARMDGRAGIRDTRSYRAEVIRDAKKQDGDLIHRLLADGTNPEHVALFVLGHGATTQNERATNPTPWCPTDCPTCDGTAWIDTGNGLAPCPERKATA